MRKWQGTPREKPVVKRVAATLWDRKHRKMRWRVASRSAPDLARVPCGLQPHGSAAYLGCFRFRTLYLTPRLFAPPPCSSAPFDPRYGIHSTRETLLQRTAPLQPRHTDPTPPLQAAGEPRSARARVRASPRVLARVSGRAPECSRARAGEPQSARARVRASPRVLARASGRAPECSRARPGEPQGARPCALI